MKKIALALLIASALAAFFVFDLDRVFSREYFLAHKAGLDAYASAHPWIAAAAYFLLYVAMAGLSLPGATALTLAGGAIFGLAKGVVLISLASTLGATLAFLVSRHLLADWARARLGRRVDAIDAGFAREGPFYLFALRLVPAFPFWLVNLALGLTKMKPFTFAWVSQIGMFPATVVYTWAGSQLGELRLSLGLVAAFVALGLLPLVAKRALEAWRARRATARWDRPRRFDYNLVVIGGGSAGLVSAYLAAATQAKVALIERHRLGGDCLNTGCVPSKALIRSARLAHDIARHRELGLAQASAEIDFATVMERVARVIAEVEPHDSAERYAGLGVEVIQGSARIASPWRVEVESAEGLRSLETRSIVIATGARPRIPPIPGIEATGYFTSDSIWSLRVKPQRLLVLGGGPIGCELALAFARLGVEVSLVDSGSRVLPREDEDVSALVAERLSEAGVQVLTGHRAKSFGRDASSDEELACPQWLVSEASDERGGSIETRQNFSHLLVAVGREPNTEGLGLEELGLRRTHTGAVETDEFLLTPLANIGAAGDVAGPWQFTHTASHQAWYASVNTLFGGLRRFRQDARVIPWCTYVDPEVARVGLNEQEARAQGIDCEVVRYEIEELDRAITDGARRGWVKLLIEPGRGKLLGATVVAERAGEMIAEWVLAMKHDLSLDQVLATIHVYPTWMEANKAAAGVWRRSHFPESQKAVLASYHAWRRKSGSLAAVIGALARSLRRSN